MEKQVHGIIIDEINKAIGTMFPYGDGRTTRRHVERWLNTIAQIAFREGKTYGLMNIFTVRDVAGHFGVTERRARALMQNRYARFGIGAKIGNQLVIHLDELPDIAPDGKYRKK